MTPAITGAILQAPEVDDRPEVRCRIGWAVHP
jgi:hypothetical protein